MTELNADSMHRLAKMALDTGEVASPEEAVAPFSRYRNAHLPSRRGYSTPLVKPVFDRTEHSRARLGGVEVCGDLSYVLSVPLAKAA